MGPELHLHLYRAPDQPFTRYVETTFKELGFRKFIIRHHPRGQHVCHVCGRRRWAKHLRIQVYYDMVWVFCAGRCPK